MKQNTLAIINGQIGPKETLNMLIESKRITGLGYLPDDDEDHVIDLNKRRIIPNISSPIVPISMANAKEDISKAQALGIQAGIVHQRLLITDEYNKNQYPILEKIITQTPGISDKIIITLSKETLPKLPTEIPSWVAGISGLDMQDPDFNEALIQHKSNRPLYANVSGSELLYVLSLASQHPKQDWVIQLIGPFPEQHVFLASTQIPKNVTLCLPFEIISPNNPSILEQIQEKRHLISCTPEQYPSLIPTLIQAHLDTPFGDCLIEMLTKAPYFNDKATNLGIGSMPSFTVLTSKNDPKNGAYASIIQGQALLRPEKTAQSENDGPISPW